MRLPSLLVVIATPRTGRTDTRTNCQNECLIRSTIKAGNIYFSRNEKTVRTKTSLFGPDTSVALG